MDQLHQHIILLLSVPIYAILIPLEWIVSHFTRLRFYSWKETLMNVYLNLLAAGLDLLLRAVALGLLAKTFQYHIVDAWNPVVYWACLFLAEDLMFWLEHFADHRIRLFWAVHVTHHSSEEFNLSTGFRSSVLMPFYRYLYFVPLALVGFRPMDILFMYALTQVYGIVLHTQYVKRLPRWIEFFFVTPGHHRVHHASNTPYLDKNMGMVLIIWDRIFGTFAEELPGEEPRYGIVKKVERPNDPVYIVTHEWKDLLADVKKADSLKSRIGYLFRAPGWAPGGNSETVITLQKAWGQKDDRVTGGIPE